MKAFLKSVLVITLTITLPITQAYAVIPESHSTLSDVVESHGANPDVNISAHGPAQIPSADLSQVEMIIGGTDEEAIEMQNDDEDLLDVPVIAVDDSRFWTQRKIVVTTSILLSTGLLVGLLLLLSGGGSGAGAGAGGGAGSAGGSGGDNPGSGGSPDSGLADPFGGLPGGSLPGGGTLPGGLPGLDGTGTLPAGKIPHNPEPSTFLLMGLGLLVPFLRKRFAR